MSTHQPDRHRLGWIGTGRMGTALVTRLLKRGVDVTVYNRTRAKAESLKMLGARVTYVGDGERARLVKICHNLVLGVVTQILAETTVVAERGGIARADYLDFINGSVMGSTFTQYKTPAFVNLDFTPTFTGHLLRKDFELGLDAARQLKVPVPVSSLVHEIIVKLIDAGLGDGDFAALLELEARAANLNLAPDARPVSDGLSPENSDDGAA